MGRQHTGSILCIGCAVMDITARPIPDAGWDQKQRIQSISLQIGGDGANQACRLSDLGHHVYLNTIVGADDNGHRLIDELSGRGVDTRYVYVSAKGSTGVSLVLVNPEGERHIFSVRGVHKLQCADDLPEDIPDDLAAVTIGSLFLLPELEREGLVQFLMRVREKEIPIFADLAWDEAGDKLKRIRKFLPLIDHFLPSRYDVLEITGSSNAQEAAAALRRYGAATVVVKCGAEGCLLMDDEHPEGLMIPAQKVKPVDTTGAGDSMVAAYISRILNGDSPEQACRYGCAYGSLSTLHMGASAKILTHEDVEDFLRGEIET